MRPAHSIVLTGLLGDGVGMRTGSRESAAVDDEVLVADGAITIAMKII